MEYGTMKNGIFTYPYNFSDIYPVVNVNSQGLTKNVANRALGGYKKISYFREIEIFSIKTLWIIMYWNDYIWQFITACIETKSVAYQFKKSVLPYVILLNKFCDKLITTQNYHE